MTEFILKDIPVDHAWKKPCTIPIHFSYDILCLIFDIFEQDDDKTSLLNCAFVCSRWNDTARRYLFRSISIQPVPVEGGRNFDSFLSFLRSASHIARLIIDLQIFHRNVKLTHHRFSDSGFYIRLDDLVTMLSLLPRLRTLHLNHIDFTEKYWLPPHNCDTMYSSQIPFNLQSLRIEHIAYVNMDRLAACMMYRFFSLFGEVDEFIMHFKLPEFSEKIEWPDVAEDLAAELEESPLRLRIRNLILDNTPTAVYAFLNASPAIQERCITKLNLVINTSSDHLDAECSRLVEQCGSNVLNMHLDARNRCRTILGIESRELLSLAAFSNLHRFCASLEFPDTPRWVNVNTVQMLHTLSSTLPLVEIVFKVHIVSYDNLKKFSIFRKHGWETLDRFLQCFKQLKWVAFEFEVDIQDPMVRGITESSDWVAHFRPIISAALPKWVENGKLVFRDAT
ncbi:hypothetical protein C8Q75DRAFT_177900 [Abortiporus biennis]|nr:hypothetical protein C8Q75DRAFT_177900 [Abortiporus biennis]